MPMRCDLLIPMKDEAEALPALFGALRRLPDLLGPTASPRLVGVDDGSEDGTADRFEALAADLPFPALLVRRPRNGGIGAALRSAAPRLGGEAVVTYDADLPYALEEIPVLLEGLAAGADVVTASPWHRDGGAEAVPAARVGLSRLASLAYRLRFPGAEGPATWTCGFRAWRRATFLACLPRRDGFVATAEMLVRARDRGARIAEHPALLATRVAGRSKMRALRVARAHLGLLARGAGPGPSSHRDRAAGRRARR